MTSELEQARAAVKAIHLDRLATPAYRNSSGYRRRLELEVKAQAALIAALEAEVTRLQGAREALQKAVEPIRAINRSYLEESHIVNPSDFDTEYWNWIVGRVSASYMRGVFEGIVQAARQYDDA